MSKQDRFNKFAWSFPGLLGLLVLGALLYNFDTFTGQYKFNRMCDRESGGRIYQLLEPGAGWLVEGRIGESYAFETPLSFGPVGFVRAQDKAGTWFDVIPDPQRKGKFIFKPSNQGRAVRYRYKTTSLVFPEDTRFERTQLQIVDLANGRIAATYTTLYYEWTKPERVILHAPTSQSCQGGMEEYLGFVRALFPKIASDVCITCSASGPYTLS